MILTLYTRPGCHLCEEMKEIIARVRKRVAFDLREIDISTDPELERRYGEQIPVLMAPDRILAKYRIAEAELARRLQAE